MTLTERQRDALRALDLWEVAFDAPLTPWLRVPVGGVAEARVRVADEDQEQTLRKWARRERLPFTEVDPEGLLLVRDGGLQGIVLVRGDGGGESAPVDLFEDPPKGRGAAVLLADSGLAGIRIRGARLDGAEPNRLRVEPDTKARDVELLVDWARRKVAADWGVELTAALQVVGELD